MGALDYLSNFCTVTSTGRRKRKPLQVLITYNLHQHFCITCCLSTHTHPCGSVCVKFARVDYYDFPLFLFAFLLISQTVEIKVKMDCDGCERRVKNAVKNMKCGFIILLYMHVLHFLKLFSLNYSEGLYHFKIRVLKHLIWNLLILKGRVDIQFHICPVSINDGWIKQDICHPTPPELFFSAYSTL